MIAHDLRRWLLPQAWHGLLCALLLCASITHAEDQALSVHAPSIEVLPDGLVLSARLEFDVPQQVEQALQDGAVLELVVQIHVTRHRHWWPDATLGEREQRYQLQFHSVSGRYVLRNLNDDSQRTFITLTEALVSMRQLEHVPLPDFTQIPADERDEVNLRANLALHSIPGVLKVLLFWRSEFSLQSIWYSWPLTWIPSLQTNH